MAEPILALAFITGLLGGFSHCVGMCGPIVGSYAVLPVGAGRRALVGNHLLYNAGRITTYMFVGAMFGLASSVPDAQAGLMKFKGAVQILAGLFMLYFGLSIAAILSSVKSIEFKNSKLMKVVNEIKGSQSAMRHYPLGLVMGLMPCGLSYSVFFGAAGTGSMFKGMLLALSFGLGTFPALLLLGVSASWFSSKLRGRVYRLSGLVVLAMGIMFVLRGINFYAHM